jgi:hypothetical protein
MNNATDVARWYRRIDLRCFAGQSPAFTVDEVRRVMDPSNTDQTERATAVLSTATVPSDWLPLVHNRHRQGLGSIADRLPTLVAFYQAGTSLAEMRDRFGGWSTWRYERALDLAFGSIARKLNRGRLFG